MRGSRLSVTAYDWVPDFAQGQVRDLRVCWALEEAEFPYEVELLPQGTQSRPENVARQPFGQVPVLEVDGHPLFESGAIVWRIAEASDTLLPAGVEERDRCFSWYVAALNTIEPPLGVLADLWFYEQMPEAHGVEDPEAPARIRPAARAGAERRLKSLEDALGDRPVLVGKRFTAADLMTTTVLRIAKSLGVLDGFPALQAYVDRHTERPAFKRALAGQMKPFAENAATYQGAA